MAEIIPVRHCRPVRRRPWWLAVGAFLSVVACNTAGLNNAPSGGSNSDPLCTDDEENCTSSTADAGKKRDGGTAEGGSATPTSTGVSILVAPETDYSVSNAVTGAIRSAKTSVHMTMYLLTDSRVIDALGDMVDAGKDVKVVLNRNFPSNGGDDGGNNDDSIGKLKARGVKVKWASSTFNYTHAKTIVVDGEKALISTMNMAFSSPRSNREFIAVDTDPQDVADCEKLFEADYADGADGTANPIELASKLVISPTAANTNGSPQTMLKDFIASAQTSLDVEVQSLSDPTLYKAIIAKKQEGVPTRVILAKYDNTLASSTSVKAMVAAGVEVKALTSPTIHAKSVVVDKARVWVGSQNFTTNALTRNREVGVFTAEADAIANVEGAIDTDWAAGAAP